MSATSPAAPVAAPRLDDVDVDIAVVDYGMGNLRSVEKALEHVGARPRITSSGAEIEAADGVVLPGVGAFKRAMENLRAAELDAVVSGLPAAGVPVLGICLGLQLLFDASHEGGLVAGLGLMGGSVERIDPGPGRKVPHMGWNEVSWCRESELTRGIPDMTPFYFVHSYAARPAASGDALGTVNYGSSVVCAVQRAPIYGVQFHPEKSSAAGLALLRNFCLICARAGRRGGAG